MSVILLIPDFTSQRSRSGLLRLHRKILYRLSATTLSKRRRKNLSNCNLKKKSILELRLNHDKKRATRMSLAASKLFSYLFKTTVLRKSDSQLASVSHYVIMNNTFLNDHSICNCPSVPRSLFVALFFCL